MKHLRNLIWLLFHPGAWKTYWQTRDYRQELHDDILDHLKNFQGPNPPAYLLKGVDRDSLGNVWKSQYNLKPIDNDNFPYTECFSCDSFAMKTKSGEHDCLGVKSWILCGYLLRGARLKKKP